MNLCVVSKGSFTKEDYMELYNFFKDDIAKYTDAFDLAFVKDGHVMIMCNVTCLLYTSPSPRDLSTSRMPSSA